MHPVSVLVRSIDDGSGDVSHEEFVQVCARLGVSVSMPEAAALFKRFGYDALMPYAKWSAVLLTQPSRQIAEEMPSEYGASSAGRHT